MPYPKDLIQDGETLALDLRPHWWYFSRNIFTGIPLLIIIILLFSETHGDVRKYLGWIVGLMVLAWAAWLVLKYFQWVMTYFVVTSRRVIYRTGVISKKGVEIPLERVNNINFHQRIIDRIIGAGDLDIESAGKDGQSHFDFIRHPDGVQHEIYRQMEFRNMPQMQPSPVAAPVPTPRGNRARADRAARAPARPGPHQRGRVRAEEGAAPRADVAPSTAVATNPAATNPVASPYRVIVRASTSCASARRASATTQPPKPAPVSRAPGGAALHEHVDEHVELRRRHLVVVAEAGVTLRQQRTEHRQVTGRQRGGGLEHPRVLGDDVTSARGVGDLVERRVAEGGDPEPGGSCLALGSSGCVRAGGERAGESAVHDDHRDVGRDRHRLDRE